jgi:ribonuclease P protein component
VRRNKLKRQLRELARTQLLPRSASADLLLRARRESYAATFETLKDDVAGVAAGLAST